MILSTFYDTKRGMSISITDMQVWWCFWEYISLKVVQTSKLTHTLIEKRYYKSSWGHDRSKDQKCLKGEEIWLRSFDQTRGKSNAKAYNHLRIINLNHKVEC